VRFSLFFGGLGVLVPDCDASWVGRKVPLSQPMARMALEGCHSMQVGVIERESSYWCLSPLSLKRCILLEVVMAMVGLIGTLDTPIRMILSWLFLRSLISVFEKKLIINDDDLKFKQTNLNHSSEAMGNRSSSSKLPYK
jgi:hypothetical protein